MTDTASRSGVTIARWVVAGALAAHTAFAGAASRDRDDPGIDWHPATATITPTCDRVIGAATASIESALDDPAGDDDRDATGRLARLDEAIAIAHDDLAAIVLAADLDNDAMRRASAQACRDRLAALRPATAGRAELYRLAQAAARSNASPMDRALATHWLAEARARGAALSTSKRRRLHAAQAELAALEQAFMRDLFADRSEIALDRTVADALPPALAAMARRDGDRTTMPVNLATYDTFMRQVADRATRERYLHVFYQRGGATNATRVRDAIALRHRIATMLGCASFSDCQLATRMARDPGAARRLVDDVARRLLPGARAEVATLAAMKRADGDASPFTLVDYLYYQERLMRTRHAIDAEAIRRHFPLEHVTAQTLAIYADLFGITFTPLPRAPTWADGVRAWRVDDARTHAVLGFLYLDLLPREGKSLRPASYLLRQGYRRRDDGTVVATIAAMVGNLLDAAPGEPTLMTHRDVVEFFHEFGHLMHGALSQVPYASLHASRVPVDFVEAPSQMLENWMWQPAVLRRVSRHVDTGRPLDDATIARLVAAQHAAAGFSWTRQAALATFDLDLHGRKPPRDPDAAWRAVHARLSVVPFPADARPSASFLPVMGGYEAGYYGYLWSRVYAQDMFTVFERDGVDDRTAGRRYRDLVIAPGASRDPREQVERFVGRPLRTDAFLRNLGLDVPP